MDDIYAAGEYVSPEEQRRHLDKQLDDECWDVPELQERRRRLRIWVRDQHGYGNWAEGWIW